MKNLEKAIILSLMLSGVGSSSAMALEWGLNNSGTTLIYLRQVKVIVCTVRLISQWVS